MSDERVVIVNKDDEIIGSSFRDAYKENEFRRTSGLVIYNSRNEILLAKRSMQKIRYPGKWDLSVRGGNELSDKNYREAIIRESLEELDLNLLDFELRKTIKVRSKNYFTQWFVVEINKGLDFFKINKEEVDELGGLILIILRMSWINSHLNLQILLKCTTKQ